MTGAAVAHTDSGTFTAPVIAVAVLRVDRSAA